MARRRAKYDNDTFYAFLNSHDDLTAVIHGLSSLDALMDEALAAMLVERQVPDDAMRRASTTEKAAALIVANRLDAELYGLIVALVGVRNAFAHHLKPQLTKADGHRVWDAMPPRAQDRRPVPFNRDRPAGRIVRWAIVIAVIRVQNRAIYHHESDLPYA